MTGDDGGVTSLTAFKKNYKGTSAGALDACTTTTADVTACQASTCAPTGWTLKAFFVDRNQKRLSVDVTRAWNTNVTEGAQVLLTNGTTYKLGINWFNATIGACTDKSQCKPDTWYKENNANPPLTLDKPLQEGQYPANTLKGDKPSEYTNLLVLNSASKLVAAMTAVIALAF